MPRRTAVRTVVVRQPDAAKDGPTLKNVELACRCVLQLLLAACAAFLCVRLCTGCAYVKAMHEEAKPAVVVLLKEAYANGGATAVSNRIERLAVEGRVTPEQAARLHVLAQRVFDGVVDRLETDALDAALAPTNAPAVK